MFSIIFPGQGSQSIGMAKDFYDNFHYIKEYFEQADEILNKNLSKIILNGTKEQLDQTENTQPAIFLVSYSIFKAIEKETSFKLQDAKFFAGHSLGEYSALCCAGSINFEQTIRLLKYRGIAMQNALPKKKGGMIAVLGADINNINEILENNKKEFNCFIANDNSIGQVVISGELKSLYLLAGKLKMQNIKNVLLPVSAPFHCPLMKEATKEMKTRINETRFLDPKIEIVSNVTSKPVNNADEIKKLLVEQIEKPVRWRESVNNMINSGVSKFIEMGPGKVLSGLVKRINRNVTLNQVNNLIDIKDLIND